MPATNQRAVDKARSLACDVVILDLEDAVAPDAKDLARQQAAVAVRAGLFGRRETVIRINTLETPWGKADLEAAVAAQPDGILVPKVSSAKDITHYAQHITGRTKLWAMIETCGAILQLAEVAAASRACGVAAWIIGPNDLAKEMRCILDLERRPLHAALSLAVIAARARGIAILDGVYNDISDLDGLRTQCLQGAAFGFDGKSLIHPSKIQIANDVFSPTAEQIAWSRTVVEAFSMPENTNKGAIRVEGRMVERLHLKEAKRILSVVAAIQA